MQTPTAPFPVNTIIHGDCVDILSTFPPESVDFILTDPPYLVSYRPRDGRHIAGDDDDAWLEPSFREMYRVLKKDAFCATFYGWPSAHLFVSAFRKAGFRPVSHISFVKSFPSCIGYTKGMHEVMYLLAKGKPQRPADPPPDVLCWPYHSGNELHPAQKPAVTLLTLIEEFSKPGDTVLDPFCGSGACLYAAKMRGRNVIGIEIEGTYARIARNELAHAAALHMK